MEEANTQKNNTNNNECVLLIINFVMRITKVSRYYRQRFAVYRRRRALDYEKIRVMIIIIKYEKSETRQHD